MSKRLVLMRHGHAQQAAEDFIRPLSARGKEAAAQAAEQFAAAGLQLDAVLCSSAQRALHTAEIVCEHCNLPPPEERRDLYLAPASDYLDVLRGLPDQQNAVLLVAHNPGISELARRLLALPVSLAPAEYASELYEIDSWRQLGQ